MEEIDSEEEEDVRHEKMDFSEIDNVFPFFSSKFTGREHVDRRGRGIHE